ncbi:amino acid ABC transporter substrate-binding protein [Vibrio pectenicida]|uniref:Amino acid ABC transporter substrate-binding protein n=1 Tax=Vibrio pectenicida TaxID=62763 RepID=A0A7Y4A2X4_9VIBR|nr:amino acid ABC transporter substrate-binding protein [Vibrio pectenicida]
MMPKVLSLILFLFVAIGPVKGNEVILSADLWCPYTCEPSAKDKGILVDAIESILQQSGHKLDYQLVNWARAIKMTRSGKYDGIVGAYISDAPDFVFHTEPIQISKMCFFVKKNDQWKYFGKDTLKNRKISVVNAYSYGEYFDNYIVKNHNQGDKSIVQISGMDITQTRVEQLNSNQIDTVLEDWRVFPYNISNYKKNNEVQGDMEFKNVGCLPGEGLYIALSPSSNTSKGYAEIINKGLKQLADSGKLNEIISRYE